MRNCLPRRFSILLYFSFTVTALGPLVRDTISPIINGSTYDFIVIGGGLSGLVVANRLSEDPSKNVLVIENGPIDNGPATSVPYQANIINTGDMWPLFSAPEPFLNNQSFRVSVGNVVGGGTIVNGMGFDRGSDADYDAWEQLGNVGWGYEGLKPYFKKSQKFTPPSKSSAKAFNITYDASAYGDSGPVAVTIPSYEYPDMTPILYSWAAENISMPREGFADPIGAYWCPNDINNLTQTRAHSRASYYDPVQNRTNLKLLPNTKVTRIVIETINGQLVVTGVEMINNNDGSLFIANASREVILAAGAIFTPHLLMLSGVGPRDVLTAARVPVKLNAPGVGSNLQDHPTLYQMFNLSNQSFPNPSTLSSNTTFYAAAEAQYKTELQGPWTYGRVSAAAFLPLKQWAPNDFTSIANQVLVQNMTDYLPARYSGNSSLLVGYKKQRDILVQAYLGDDAASGEAVIAAWGHNTIALEKPLSRGTITLNTTDPTNLPIVQWNALQNPIELDIIIEMIRFSRRHWARPELARYSPVESLPGTLYQTNAEIIGSITTSGLLQPTFAHPSCSCAMMPQDLGGVVNDQLLVYGVKGLSIVDASIMPLIPATHLQATMYAVSEKASDIIKARHGYQGTF